jgi:hypothetical protein
VAEMSVSINVTPDRERVSIALLEDGKHLGWIEFAASECDSFIKLVGQYRAMLTDVLPAPRPATRPGRMKRPIRKRSRTAAAPCLCHLRQALEG